MTIKDLLVSFNITQEEFAEFSGFPRNRIAGWIRENRESPPKVEDLNIFNTAIKWLTDNDGRNIKSIAKKWKMVDGSVIKIPNKAEDKKEDDETDIINGKAKSNSTKSGTKNVELTNTQNSTLMAHTERLMNMLEQSIASADRTSRSLEKIAEANANLSAMLMQHLGAYNQKGRMHVKPTEV